MRGRKEGYKHTEKEKKRISKSLKGRRVSPKTEFKKGHGNKNNPQQGSKNNNWKGGISSKNLRIRASKEYKLWKESVLKRDNYQCIWCGSKIKICADHIKPFALFPELRFAIDNGRTLCERCHKTTDTFAGKSNKLNNREVK